MVEISKLTKYIQDALNTAKNGLKALPNTEFQIFTDTGVLKRDIREENTVKEIINGVVSVGASDRFFLSNGLEFSTLPLTAEFIFALEDEEEDGGFNYEEEVDGIVVEKVSQNYIGNETKIATIRKILDTAFNSSQTTTELKDEKGNAYATSIIAQIAEDGERGENPVLGFSFSFSVNFYFTFVENGINSREGTFRLDGVELPYSTMSITKIKSVDNVVLSGENGNAGNVINFVTTGFTFELPALAKGDNKNKFLTELLANDDLISAHVLTVDLDGVTRNYLVHLTENNATLSGIQNIGLKLTFAIAIQNLEFVKLVRYYGYKATGFVDFTIDNANEDVVYVVANENGQVRAIDIKDGDNFKLYAGYRVFSTKEITDTSLPLQKLPENL